MCVRKWQEWNNGRMKRVKIMKRIKKYFVCLIQRQNGERTNHPGFFCNFKTSLVWGEKKMFVVMPHGGQAAQNTTENEATTAKRVLH